MKFVLQVRLIFLSAVSFRLSCPEQVVSPLLSTDALVVLVFCSHRQRRKKTPSSLAKLREIFQARPDKTVSLPFLLSTKRIPKKTARNEEHNNSVRTTDIIIFLSKTGNTVE